MQFRDLKNQYQILKPKLNQAIIEVMTAGTFIGGRQIAELEIALSTYVGTKHCITCANGTDALTLMMMAWNIGIGDAVFVPDFTFFSSAEVIAYEGATPIFVDVEPDTFNIDVDKFEKSIEKVIAQGKLKPKAIIGVDLFGLPADYIKIEEVAKKYNLLVLEDAAQGFGGKIGNRRAGSFGNGGTTSFFPAKPLGCYGDGGAIFTNDDKIAEQIRSLKVHGKGTDKYDNVRLGMNSRLDTIQGAILKVKLEAFKEYELTDVNKVAKLYDEKLKEIVKTPTVLENFYSSWAQYTITLKDQKQRDGLQEHLKTKEIPSMIYYPKGMHEQTAFKNLNCCKGDFEVSERLCKTVLSLPMHPYLKEEDIELVCETIKEYISKQGV